MVMIKGKKAGICDDLLSTDSLWSLVSIFFSANCHLPVYILIKGILQVNLIKLAGGTYIQNEPVHEISNNVVCVSSKGLDQPADTRSLIRAFARRLFYEC